MSGKDLKEQGQQLALFNAGPEWLEATLRNLEQFCKERKAANQPEFRFEEFRQVLEQAGADLPHSHKAWGAVPRVAADRKIIAPTSRYEAAQSRRTHAHPVRVWRAM